MQIYGELTKWTMSVNTRQVYFKQVAPLVYFFSCTLDHFDN